MTGKVKVNALKSIFKVFKIIFKWFYHLFNHPYCLPFAPTAGWPVVVTWGLMSCQYFYCLGHTPTVTSLRFEAAFAVIDGDVSGVNLLAAGVVVGLNTLASQVCQLNVHPSFTPSIVLSC